MEALLRLAILGTPMEKADREFWDIDDDARIMRSQAIHILAELVTPPKVPSREEIALRMIRAIFQAPNHVLHGSIVEKLFPKDVVNGLFDGGYVKRTLSGYYLTDQGQEALRQSEEKKDDRPTQPDGT